MSDIVETNIQSAVEQTVQTTSRPTLGGVFPVLYMAAGNYLISPWWSSYRDRQLNRFWMESDHLSGAVYTMTSKMTAIPSRVVPRNISIERHVRQAQYYTDVLQAASNFGEGWVDFYSKFVTDLLTQDNGAFVEVIGPGSPAGPITAAPIAVAHLDSQRCQRTGDREFPVVYLDENGKLYKLHRTRVMSASQMASTRAEMYGVGLCAVSRCVNVAQTLIDILVYKQEKLGSRPHRQLIITKGGLDPEDMRTAFELAEAHMDDIGLRRYAKVVIGGSSTMPDADLRVIELSSLPDGFDEQTSITLGMATIALAFGVDARELFPAMTSGATRADALLQHLKQRGKGPGQILQLTEQIFNYKFVPPHLQFVFDFQDDAQDRQVAEIRKIRADRRVQDLSTNALNDRVLREQMVEDGDITRDQFNAMELEDGRLPDGTEVVNLFYQKGGEYSRLLDVGTSDPANVAKNNPVEVLDAIASQSAKARTIIVNSKSPGEVENARVALAALNQLKIMYETPMLEKPLEEIPAKPAGEASRGVDGRVRTKPPTAVQDSNYGLDGREQETYDDEPE